MKKIFLLLTIICVSALHGMQKQRSDWDYLPTEIKQHIINTALATSKTADEAIKAIDAISELQGAHLGLKSFTELIHMLTDKFHLTTEEIANKFKTPIATKYIHLNQELMTAIASDHTIEEIKQLLNQGADVNYSEKYHVPEIEHNISGTPLHVAVGSITGLVNKNKENIIKLLLNAGADPFWKNSDGQTALEYTFELLKLYKETMTSDDFEVSSLLAIMLMLDEAMEKQKK